MFNISSPAGVSPARVRQRKAGRKGGEMVFNLLLYAALLLLGFLTLYPFWNALVISFNTGIDTANGGVTFWPRSFTLDNYRIVFQNGTLLSAFFISIARTVVGTTLSIFVTAMFAYSLSRKELIGRKFYMVLCIIPMYFSGGLIPTYLLIRDLHMLDTFWVLVVPGLVSVWNMIIFRTFFQSLPAGLEEAARVDGCNYISTFFRIVLPLSGPVIATLTLFTAVGNWNAWFDASIYISSDTLLPLQNILMNLLNSTISKEQLLQMGAAATDYAQQTVTQRSLIMTTLMVTTIPIIIVYPFVQKYFAKGVLIGSLKE